MAQLDRIRDARREAQRAALLRWQQRQPTRAITGSRIAAGGPGAADSPMRQERFKARQTVLDEARAMRRRNQLPFFIERKIGPTLDFDPFAPSEAARKAGRPVARIVDTTDPRVQAQGYGTAFLITPRLLITNHHVLQTRGDARGQGANFLYEQDERGLARGITFELDPDLFYANDLTLDYAVVGIKPTSVEGQSLDQFNPVALIEATSKILQGHNVNVIQFPEGGAKQYVTRNNRLLDILETGFLHYEADTGEGSSGSPVFSEVWELVALHHASIPEIRGQDIIDVRGRKWDGENESDVHWIANEGARVSAIVGSLAKLVPANQAEASLLKELLAGTKDPVDEITEHLRGPRAISPLASPQLPDQAMTTNQFVFSGPVTIHVHAPAAQPPAEVLKAPAVLVTERAIRFDPDYDAREGYAENFLDPDDPTLMVRKPGVNDERRREMLRGDGGQPLELHYHHYTIAMNAKRRLQMWSAVNVDYDPEKKPEGGRSSFGTDKWIPDPRIPGRVQIFDAEFYKPAGQIDRGHIVRREDNVWGETEKEQEFANSDTFHWTNCTPQHQAFNRDAPGSEYLNIRGLWGNFEKYIQENLQKPGETKACILAGPVLAETDPEADFGLGPVKYPENFWKVVVVAEPDTSGNKTLKAYGFVLSQKDVLDRFGIEAFRPGRFRRYQASLREITRLTGVTFDRHLYDADQKQD